MGKLLKINEAAKFLNVSIDTLRKWDKTNKLNAIKTNGKHRRYDIDDLNEFLGLGELYKYKEYYSKLCSAEYLANKLGDKHVNDIRKIRLEVANSLVTKYLIADDTIGFNISDIIGKKIEDYGEK